MTATLRLRDYQREAIDAVFESWHRGMRRPAIVLPTGMGKTVVFAHLISEFREMANNVPGTRVIVLVHRDELADQAIGKIRAVAPELSVGKVKADDNEIHADVMVCSVQTISRHGRLATLAAAQQRVGAVGLIITDECFPAGTRVGGSPIEHLRKGDVIPTWNEETGTEELRPVRAIMSRVPSSLVRVTLADGSTFACTPNHPILTAQGWCPAGGLWRGASVVSFTHDANASVHGVPDPVRGDSETSDRHAPQVRAGVLHHQVSGRMGESESVGANGPDEPDSRVGPNDGAQSDDPAGRPGEGIRQPESDGPQAPVSGRERKTDTGSPTGFGGIPGVADGVLRDSSRRTTSVPLQGGHRPSFDEGVRGSGWGVPLLSGPPSLRPAPGRTVALSRVVGVQVLESGRDGTYGGVCPDGLVYNVEVDTTHTYLINGGLVVHNCHHAAALSYQTVYGAFPGALQLGVTATLARGDGVGLGTQWEDVVYSRSILNGIANGHLVDVKAHNIVVEGFQLDRVKQSRGDYQASDLGDALEDSGGDLVIAKAYREHASDRPGVVFTPTVATAELTRDALTGAGITAACISGETPREERRDIFEDFRTGRTQVLVNCMVLTEGWDAPWASCAVIARPTKSQPLYIQMVGRVLRPWPAGGKTDALVLNLNGAGGKLATLIDLEPGLVEEIREGETLTEAVEREEAEGHTLITRGHPAFGLKMSEVNLFAASGTAWLSTAGGVMFIGAGEWTYFLWQSKTEDGGWDVCRKPKRGRWERTEHTGLSAELAMSWAEAEAENYGSFSVSRKASWRGGKASEAQMQFAYGLGIDATQMSKAEVSDAISMTLESRALDPFIGVV